jgi:hypothetical protein
VLEQVQRGAAAAVEQLHVIGLGAQRRCAQQPLDQTLHFAEAVARQRAFVDQGLRDPGQCRTQAVVGVAQQPGDGAQRVRNAARRGVEDLHDHSSALMGMVRFFSLPKRLVSVTPSLQPLPKLKPQPPRTLKAFSAYSRCVVGMTKRSS